MKFSMGRMMAVVGFVSLLMAAAFAMPPYIGLPVLTLISLLFLPQLIWMGAIHTTGRARAFFVGAILSGIPHFVVSAYWLFAVALTFDLGVLTSSDELHLLNYAHLVGCFIGFLGGLGGVLAHWLIVPKNSNQPISSPIVKPETVSEFATRQDKHPLDYDTPIAPNLPK